MTNRIPDGPVRERLAAVLEALDIPDPATVGDTETHREILAERAMHAAIPLRNVLDHGGHPLGIEWITQYLRERLAENQSTGYRHWGERP